MPAGDARSRAYVVGAGAGLAWLGAAVFLGVVALVVGSFSIVAFAIVVAWAIGAAVVGVRVLVARPDSRIHVRFGPQVRALRRRRGWRQVDLSLAADMSRASVSRIERGHAGETTLAALDAVARALSARLEVGLSWNGEGLDRLLDADHAAIVELVARELRALERDVAVEVTFNIRGERGSIDILAFHPATGVILVVEVKSVVPDLQATVFTLDRKSRLAIEIARARGWRGVAMGRILVVADGRTSRRRVAAHEATFAAAFPARGVAVRRWLRSPDPGRRFSGLWFLAIARGASARQRVASAPRVPRT